MSIWQDVMKSIYYSSANWCIFLLKVALISSKWLTWSIPRKLTQLSLLAQPHVDISSEVWLSWQLILPHLLHRYYSWVLAPLHSASWADCNPVDHRLLPAHQAVAGHRASLTSLQLQRTQGVHHFCFVFQLWVLCTLASCLDTDTQQDLFTALCVEILGMRVCVCVCVCASSCQSGFFDQYTGVWKIKTDF